MTRDLQATEAVRRRMQRTARKDNTFERTIRSQLHARGLRYRIHYPIPGLKRTTCDFAFTRMKIAVFLDGCFWHGCEMHPPSVKKNAEFWLEKIARNRARDARATAHLTGRVGWCSGFGSTRRWQRLLRRLSPPSMLNERPVQRHHFSRER
ncbi:very short patch repair endonuclease [Agrobacterium cavarae]|uniref:very short patch repair endonuclease n=1 Tax=Agrobacterium cavarae TaxID=2528239 RepID=UPI003AB9B9D7